MTDSPWTVRAERLCPANSRRQRSIVATSLTRPTSADRLSVASPVHRLRRFRSVGFRQVGLEERSPDQIAAKNW